MQHVSQSRSEVEEEVENDQAEQARRVRDIRPVSRTNKDGTSSTVLLTSANIDGKHVAFPTLFPKSTKVSEMSTNPKDWIELEGIDAYKEALKRGELFTFDTKEQASEFAKGSWKDF